MDSQEAAGNAAKSASDHGRNVVKSNPLLPPGFRARPQGPPGSPRHPINNGPIGQSRPEGQPQQIGYDVRPPFGPPGSAQFAQHGPHEPPRPLGNLLAQRPPQQGQNPPILLNPRFPASPPARINPQQRPRLLNPGNYQTQQFQRNLQQAHKTGPEHQNVPPEVRSPEGSVRPQQIAQRPLQRNESLLNIPRQRLPFPKDDKTPTLPRIIVERMADVDNARKPQQFENSKDKMRENAENDDDDDVVMDGKKSSRPASGLSDQRELIDSKSPKKDVQSKDGTVDSKSKDTVLDKVNATANHRSDKLESQMQEPVKDSNNRLPSAKSDEKTHVEASDRGTVEKVDHKSDKPVEKAVEDKNATEKVDLSKDCATKPSSPSIPASAEDKSRKIDTCSASNLPSKGLSNDQSSKATAESQSKTQATLLEQDQKHNEQKSNELPKSPGKSEKGQESEVCTKTSIEVNQSQQELKVPGKSPDKSRASIPAGNAVNKNEEELQAPSKSPDRSPISTPEMKQSQNEKKGEGQDKSADECRQEQEPNKLNSNAEAKDNQMKQEAEVASKIESKQELNIPSKPSEKSPEKTLTNLNNSLKEKESKDSVVSMSNQLATEKSTVSGDKTSIDTVTTKASDKVQQDEPDQGSLEIPTSVSRQSSPTVTKETSRSPNELSVAESVLSPPKSPDSVKGFDNGQRRPLSAKLSPRSPRSPRSPTSPTSPNRRAKAKKEENKKATFDENSIGQKTSASKIHRTPTPAKLSPATPDIENGSATNGTEHIDTTPTTNGVSDSPMKKSPSKSKDCDKRSTAGSPVKSPSKSVKSLPRTPETPSSTGGQEKKKLPMNKIQVGAAPSPNLKTVRSKIGSLENASYKPGGGKVKIENRKLDFSKAQPKIAAKNEKYTPSGGDKKIAQVKLQWNAKSKVGSLENATYKPGGGDKKIETVKLDFKDKAKPKVGSKDNAKHVPGGGAVKSSATPPKTPQDSTNDIQTQKIDIKAESKIGSLDNVKHKPGGGDKKIFNDKDYLRQTGSNVESLSGSGSQIEGIQGTTPFSTQQIQDVPQPPPTTPTKVQKLVSPTSAMIPKAVSNLAKSSEITYTGNGTKKSPNSQDDKNITLNKTTRSLDTTKSTSSKLRLPKLVTSSTPQETTSLPKTHSNVTLPKLNEFSTELTRIAH